MSEDNKGTLKKEEEVIKKELRQHNLFPLMAGGFAVFFLMTSMVVAMPFMYYTNTPSDRATEYTALESQGRDLYMSLGCFYCHSQFVRTNDWAIGNTSTAGDYVYDSPQSLGTERTGPDLSQIGGMRPIEWHKLHDTDPRSTSPGSIMPNFGFLTDEELNALVAYVNRLGSENLATQSFQPTVPAAYSNSTNAYSTLMAQVAASYDAENQNYTGSETLGTQWADVVDSGKLEYTKVCLSCHGCSGNGQGPYARHVITRPANLNERIANYPSDAFQLWRISEGVPGTAMPQWALSLNATMIMKIAIYEKSFVNGSIRTISGDVSDAEGDAYANSTHITPQIAGTLEDYENGKSLFQLYCAQCHGEAGQGDGPASIKTPGGYINPEPANFTESGRDFKLYGRYVWKVKEGVETTNMPPWKYALSNEQINQVIFYIQTFATSTDYQAKWGPLYSDSYARDLGR